MISFMLMSDKRIASNQDAGSQNHGMGAEDMYHDVKRDRDGKKKSSKAAAAAATKKTTSVASDDESSSSASESKIVGDVEAPMVKWVNRSKSYVNHSYRDFANCKPSRNYIPINNIEQMTFVQKIHHILSQKHFEDSIHWQSHGRAFVVAIPKTLETEVLPLYFGHGRFSSFLRQLSNHGFKYITSGNDRNCHYHELMLRGLPHLCPLFPEPKDARRLKQDPDNEPNFYEISKQYPLPDDPNYSPGESYSSKSGKVPAEVRTSPSKDDVKKRHFSSPESSDDPARKRLVTTASSNTRAYGMPNTYDAFQSPNVMPADNRTSALRNVIDLRNDNIPANIIPTNTVQRNVAESRSNVISEDLSFRLQSAINNINNDANRQAPAASLTSLPENVSLQAAALLVLNQLQQQQQQRTPPQDTLQSSIAQLGLAQIQLPQQRHNTMSSSEVGSLGERRINVEAISSILSQLQAPQSSHVRTPSGTTGRIHDDHQQRLPSYDNTSPNNQTLSLLLAAMGGNTLLQPPENDLISQLSLRNQRHTEETKQQYHHQEQRTNQPIQNNQIDVNSILALLLQNQRQQDGNDRRQL